MSLRFSPKEAAERGFISKSDADAMLRQMAASGRKGRGSAAPCAKAPGTIQGKKPRTYSPDSLTPQQQLYEALLERLPGRIEQEKTGLVPGRQFRADIFIEPNVIVEMDGFQYHSSLGAFKNDRERQNLMVACGYLVFRAYTGQVKDDEQRAVLVDLIVTAANGCRPTPEQCRQRKSEA
ncbi:DUF559 domain-containing protein [Geopseudomonas aromaticivorans]